MIFWYAPCDNNGNRGSPRGQGPDRASHNLVLWPGPTPKYWSRLMDFSEELNTVADAWTWSSNPETQAQFISQCFRNGLTVEWWQTAEGWELRITKAEL